MSSKSLIIVVLILAGLVLGAGKFYESKNYSATGQWPTFSLGKNNFRGTAATLLFRRDKDKPAPTGLFPPVKISAKSALVYDLETGQTIFAREPGKPLPLASITKLMTVLVARENLPITTSLKIKNGSFSLTDLSDMTLVGSLNEGAAALALATSRESKTANFADLMNDKARALAMTQTHFINETGLDLNGAYGSSYGSAEDIGRLLAYIIKEQPAMIEATRQDSLQLIGKNKKPIKIINTNEAVNRLPGLLASKTGFTDIADGNLAFVIDAGIRRPFAVVILGSTKAGRFSDAEILTKAIYAYLKTESGV